MFVEPTYDPTFDREMRLRRELEQKKSAKRCRELERRIADEDSAAERSGKDAANKSFEKHVKGRLGIK
ncbi:MAG: hypothetical protein AAF950_18275 [Pseudomonadota bacterium]